MTLRHVVVDVTEADVELLDDECWLLARLPEVCEEHGAHVIRALSHQFKPQGVTVLAILAESHASIHTWPEFARAYIDVFTCGDVDALAIATDLIAVVDGRGTPRVVTREDAAPAV